MFGLSFSFCLLYLFYLFYLFFYKSSYSSKLLFENTDLSALLENKIKHKIEILEADCPILEKGIINNRLGVSADFDKKEFLMHYALVINNSNFVDDNVLELKTSKEHNINNSLVLVFYIGNMFLPLSYDSDYSANLLLTILPTKNENNNKCPTNSYSVALLKSLDVSSPSDFEYLSIPIYFTIGKTIGQFRVNVTKFFTDGSWRAFTTDKIAFHIKTQNDCYALLENKLNEPTLVIKKETKYYSAWGNWSACTMECESPDNIQIRERKCTHPDGDCFEADLKEIRPCPEKLPECISLHEEKESSTSKIVTILLPIVLIIGIIVILYHIFYKKKGAEKELYDNVVGRYMYE
ncbi:thrombospondin-related apical membrane protein [Hepatocystis sp. ex Piliocolobus tephrosceles]|nr:thrombospondin-related apical membrane protein [Hepatocystis sp. ex Piliocolobus tephrosceles]